MPISRRYFFRHLHRSESSVPDNPPAVVEQPYDGSKFHRSYIEKTVLPIFSRAFELDMIYQFTGSWCRKAVWLSNLNVLILREDISKWSDFLHNPDIRQLVHYAFPYDQNHNYLKIELSSELQALPSFTVTLDSVPQESWGAGLLHYIGPKGWNIHLRNWAQKNKLLLNQYGLRHREGPAGKYLIKGPQEAILQRLGWPNIPPYERTAEKAGEEYDRLCSLGDWMAEGSENTRNVNPCAEIPRPEPFGAELRSSPRWGDDHNPDAIADAMSYFADRAREALPIPASQPRQEPQSGAALQNNVTRIERIIEGLRAEMFRASPSTSHPNDLNIRDIQSRLEHAEAELERANQGHSIQVDGSSREIHVDPGREEGDETRIQVIEVPRD